MKVHLALGQVGRHFSRLLHLSAISPHAALSHAQEGGREQLRGRGGGGQGHYEGRVSGKVQAQRAQRLDSLLRKPTQFMLLDHREIRIFRFAIFAFFANLAHFEHVCRLFGACRQVFKPRATGGRQTEDDEDARGCAIRGICAHAQRI